MTVGEFLLTLLDEYEFIANEYTEIRVERHNELTESIRRSLEQVRGLLSAMDWYGNIPERDKTIARGYYLSCLLERIDNLHSKRTLSNYPSSDGHIVLGQRWWNVWKAISTHQKEPLERPAFSVHSLFPHIRKVRLNDKEWFTDKIIERVFERVKEDGVLKFGLCSLTGKSKTQFAGTTVRDPQLGVFGFCATSVECDPMCSDSDIEGCHDGYIHELRESIQWARENCVHILCFPELSVCPKGRKAIWSEIESDPGHLCLIVPGSYHDKVIGRDDLFTNSAPIWIIKEGRITELTSFDKTEPFLIELSKVQNFPSMLDVVEKARKSGCGYVQEHIKPGNKIRVLQTSLGVFGVVICRDQLVRPDLIERYDILTDHLLIISMNSNPAWFWFESEKAVRANLSATFYVNASQVVEPDNTNVDMVFWHIPCHLPEDSPNTSKERYFRKHLPDSPNKEERITCRQLPEDGKVCLEIKISPEMFKYNRLR